MPILALKTAKQLQQQHTHTHTYINLVSQLAHSRIRTHQKHALKEAGLKKTSDIPQQPHAHVGTSRNTRARTHTHAHTHARTRARAHTHTHT